MWKRLLLGLCIMAVAVNYHEASGFLIRNRLLGKCLTVHSGGRVALDECSQGSPLQEWRWVTPGAAGGRSHHGQHAISNLHTGDCLTAPRAEYEGVSLKACGEAEEMPPPPGEVGEVYMARETSSSQAWTCSKKGLLSLSGKGLHLSATPQSTLVFLSKDHKQQGSRWRTMDNQTVCSERDSHHPHGRVDPALNPASVPSAMSMSNSHQQPQPIEGVMDHVTELSPLNNTTSSSDDPTMVFFTMDYGMGWKITMLVLSSLALVLGTVILIVNVYANSRKKVVCVLKSYTPREEVSQPGSPVPNERAPLTKHAMRLPHSSPPLQRGEILIQWKDGTVTPLYEA